MITPCGAQLEPILVPFCFSVGPVGANLKPACAKLGQVGSKLGHSSAKLGPSWSKLGPSRDEVRQCWTRWLNLQVRKASIDRKFRPYSEKAGGFRKSLKQLWFGIWLALERARRIRKFCKELSETCNVVLHSCTPPGAPHISVLFLNVLHM